MRIAFFGGSFDPPHLGHLRIALAAADRLDLDRVLFAPVAVQPLKHDAPSPAGFADRLEMLGLLLGHLGDPRFEVSDLDKPRADGRPNYTYDTVLRLRATLQPKDELFVLTGADALMTLPHWSRALPLVLAAGFIIATRPGFPIDPLYTPLLSLAASSIVRRLDHPEPGVEHLVLTVAPGGPIENPCSTKSADFYILTGLDEDFSATAVRAALAASPKVSPPEITREVAEYVLTHRLYR